MGVLLTPIIAKRVVTLGALKGRSFAVDAFNQLHQFLAIIRGRDGSPLTDSEGRVTSHLVGLAYRTSRLIADYSLDLVFVFDGSPPKLKEDEVYARRRARERAERDYEEALERGDLATAYSKAVMTGRLTSEGIDDAKRLLSLLGIPWVQAAGEGEAQAAYMCMKGDVWAVNSRDYDSLLFGAPRLVRYLTIQGEEWLPSKGRSRRLEPEVIELEELLTHLGITRSQLIDMAILIGTDFNRGVKGIGPKTALKLIRKHGSLDELPRDIREKLPDTVEDIRLIFMEAQVAEDYNVKPGRLMEEELYDFLYGERGFSRRGVETVVRRIKIARSQSRMSDFLEGG